MTIAIILGAFIFIAQYLVGLGSFFKLLFRGFVSRVTVGVKLHGHLAVCLFYFLGGGTFCNAKDLIIISLRRHK